MKGRGEMFWGMLAGVVGEGVEVGPEEWSLGADIVGEQRRIMTDLAHSLYA